MTSGMYVLMFKRQLLNAFSLLRGIACATDALESSSFGHHRGSLSADIRGADRLSNGGVPAPPKSVGFRKVEPQEHMTIRMPW